MVQAEQGELREQREAWAGCGKGWKAGDELRIGRKLILDQGLYPIK